MKVKLKRPTKAPLLASFFSIDLRSLAALRIASGIYLMCDIGMRLTDVAGHYSDSGIFPLAALREWWPGTYWWMLTIHSVDSGAAWPACIFVIQILIAGMLIAGFQSRFAVAMSWLLLVSTHNRNPLILHGGDQMFRMTLFWMMFLPIGARWSLDGSIRIRSAYGETSQTQIRSVATLAILAQTCMIYASTALLKHSKEWWSEGSAMYYALRIEQFRLPLGGWIKDAPMPLLQCATWLTLAFELISSALMWSRNAVVRTTMVGVAFVFHMVFIALLMDVGPISFASCLLWIGLIPPETWNMLEGNQRLQVILRGIDPLLHPMRTWRTKRIALWVKKQKPLPIVSNSLPAQAVASLALIYVFQWNIVNLNPTLKPIYPDIAKLIRVDQHWGMFAPKPMPDDGWFSMAAMLPDNTKVDLFQNGKPHHFRQPTDIVHMHKNARWAKFWMNLWQEKYGRYRKYGVSYLRQKYQAEHPTVEIKQISFFYHLTITPAPGVRRAPVEPTLISSETYINPLAPALEAGKE